MIVLAFTMGLLGSLHCAVMCGPIVLGLPVQRSNFFEAFFQAFIYQLGRTCSYIILGFLIGLLGSSLALVANQELISVILGIILIALAIAYWTGQHFSKIAKMQNGLVAPLSKGFQRVFHLPFWPLLAGMLNGLIPCGMVYLALATALNTGSLTKSMQFMGAFGLGTTPMMLAITFSGFFLKNKIRVNTAKLMPWFALFIGVLFILRSSSLNVPFLSPLIHQTLGDPALCR